MPPAARMGDMHVCPMVTGIVPHVGGPILPACCPTVLIGMQPAARVSDMATCVGPPDAVAMGSPTVLIGNLMAARMGDPTLHGGSIVLGLPTVMIGTSGSGGGGGGGGAGGGAGPGAGAGSGVQVGSTTKSGGTVIGTVNGLPIVREKDGTITVGKNITIKPDKNDPSFQSKALAALIEMGNTKTGGKILDSIENNPNGKKVTIVKSASGDNSENATKFNDGLLTKDGKKGPGSDTVVDFNPDKKQIGDGSEKWMTRPPSVGLGHEMIHAAHDVNGTTEYDYSDKSKSPQNYELQAVGLKGTKDGKDVDYSGNDFTENKLRSDLKQPERTSY